jgi:asparagine synthase (glutamine-hydrolysing)
VCGIVGVFDTGGRRPPDGLIERMTACVAHRGPDDIGHFVEDGIALGHRRLAIIDLTSGGHQPMTSPGGRTVVVYNGEMFNYLELQEELRAAGRTFVSRSDTEVLLQAYEQWGEQCVERFNGQFAFLLWDRERRTLFAARDRFGVKPLYYYQSGDLFAAASEIKALLAHPEIRARVNYPALAEYFTFQNILSDLTLFDGVRLLPPGTTLTVGCDKSPRTRRYWDYSFVSDPRLTRLDECADEVYRLFEQAVRRQLLSDVPVGSYLSGGMDSGSITAVAARQIPRIHTFTAGFDVSSASGLELGFDERPSSEQLANLVKSEHYEVVLHAGDMERVLPELIWHLEDLRVGQSYPNYYVARLASKFVKVVLSGAGGDELFGGYPWRYYRAMGAPDPDTYFRSYYNYWQRLVPDEERKGLFNADAYRQLADVSTYDVFRSVFGANIRLDSTEDMVNASLYFECRTFLHGLFVVEDKLSMAHSLETRVPFLDNDLVDFAQRIPPRFKLRDLEKVPEMDENAPGKQTYLSRTNDGKVVLRAAMGRIVSEDVTTRTKQGFSAPDASWFRGESIDYINSLLRDPKARIYGFLRPEYVRRRLDAHTAGVQNHRLFIWSLLSFEWWLRRFVDG